MKDGPLNKLIGELEAALKAPPAGDDENNRPRSSIVPALAATNAYLRMIGIEERLRSPLLQLLAAQIDANEGRTNPINVKSSKQTETTKMLAFVMSQEVAAAVLVDVCKKELAPYSTAAVIDRVANAFGIKAVRLREFRRLIARRKVHPDVLEAREAFRRDVVNVLNKKRSPDTTGEQFVEKLLGIAAGLK